MLVIRKVDGEELAVDLGTGSGGPGGLNNFGVLQGEPDIVVNSTSRAASIRNGLGRSVREEHDNLVPIRAAETVERGHVRLGLLVLEQFPRQEDAQEGTRTAAELEIVVKGALISLHISGADFGKSLDDSRIGTEGGIGSDARIRNGPAGQAVAKSNDGDLVLLHAGSEWVGLVVLINGLDESLVSGDQFFRTDDRPVDVIAGIAIQDNLVICGVVVVAVQRGVFARRRRDRIPALGAYHISFLTARRRKADQPMAALNLPVDLVIGIIRLIIII